MSDRKFSWHTQKVQDKHGRYLDAELKGGSSPYVFYRCHDHYKPNRKGGHRRNHIINVYIRNLHNKKGMAKLHKILHKGWLSLHR